MTSCFVYRPGIDDIVSLRRADAPFYGNGLQHDVFAARDEGSLLAEDGHLTVTDAFPSPKFTSNCDQVREIVTMTHQALIPNAPPGMGEEMATSLSGSLSKVFVGPCGTVTRLHQDCANAHAWLGQASGRKLFVCFPPSDAAHLDVINGRKRNEAVHDRSTRAEGRPAPRVPHERDTDGVRAGARRGGAGAVRVVALRGGVGPERDGDAELFHRFAAVEPRGLGRDYHSTGQAGVDVLLSAVHSPQRGGAVLAD